MVEGKYNFCHIAERTNVGCKRSANEDWLAHFESPNGLVAVVCDGMGGHVGGQIASHTAVEAIQSFLMRESPLSPQELIVEAIKQANDAILYRASQQPELTGMGSTCVLLIVREDGRVYIGSVGDSRVYLNRSHRLIQLTKDQSYVQTLVDAGAITPEQAENHPRKNEITNALGLPNMQPATVLPTAFVPEAGDCFLLCSDGLSGMVSDHEICKIISRQGEMSQQARVDELVSRARKYGGFDNITCQLVEFAVSPKGSSNKWYKNKMLWGMLPLLLAVVGIYAWLLPKTDKDMETNSYSEKIIKLRSVPFASEKLFLELVEDKDKGIVVVCENLPDNRTVADTIHMPLSLRQMEVNPADQLEVTYNGTELTNCRFAFKKEWKDNTSITICIKNDTLSAKLIIPVIRLQTEESAMDANRGDNGHGSDVKTGEAVEQVYPASNDGSESEESRPEEFKIPVKVNKDNFVIVVNNECSEADYHLNFECTFKSSSSEEQNFGWYKIKNDCSTCTIKIPEKRGIKTGSNEIKLDVNVWVGEEKDKLKAIIIQIVK